MELNKKPRKLACVSCRKRRRKCDMQHPCSNCSRSDTECVFTNQDLRRNRYSTGYVKALEAHIAYLESSLRRIKDTTDPKQRDILLSQIPLDNIEIPNKDVTFQQYHLPTLVKMENNTVDNKSDGIINERKSGTSSREPSLNYIISTAKSEPRQRSRSPSPLPTVGSGTNSIYPTNSLSISNKKRRIEHKRQMQVNLKNLSRSPLILRSFSLFFKWLYPGHYMFIHRETFLSAFFGDEATKTYYCSEELVYAIAALGSKASKQSEELYEQRDIYYHHAKSIVLKKIFQLEDKSLAESTSSSKLAIIQTLLCLAFYDIGSGENPMAWYLSGLAFRISHEIGLHLNPKAWDNVYEDELSKMDIEVRSRIYWGCYIADHLISILFGRSTSLRLSNSTVPETDELPDIETGIEDYIYNPGEALCMANPLKKLIILSRITEIFAKKIFIQTETIEQRIGYLSKFNSEAMNWRNDLNGELQWDKQSLKKLETLNITTVYVWYHYYIVIISYNKPFLFESSKSRKLIKDCIHELHALLNVWKKRFGTFERCSLYMVYSAILSIQCMDVESIKDNIYSDFEDFLKSNTLNYEVAKKFIESSKNMENNNEFNSEFTDLLGSLSHGTDFALEYNFDFTLLNEIDNLITSNPNTHTLTEESKM
ncbi:similar to Saccharomyces cerevisiae YLR098C CHA4 DNA binding transcriptional activator, mediates serine/threonine activation of the catabolic L-serine (L-threonine) deaminase (CHA1) [Maudiozyma saulgeensis]|uniref:Similar to Saccharomyces cerevisiae YLR098C CHA4 DNA binding transcriptional activator, mediates serine/threonine activation of the catabolic L-serine (L-threonine) deaminase (CHA1) n=1 Tax=Maudiozyma saulgeensis TaxID=1789683 RepID=A0A1X7R8T4_9SACH|nr:similar to Saccharomyces cerevisiae YLR098C CHA4 DNA binding transcriptional activator, mediates serine/threonine activation of the catabolic L-serine (L-threonine) deaminase (CHA1) [Kazachstania saulgeensis]